MTEYVLRTLSNEDYHLLSNVADGVFDNAVDESFAREFLADPRHHIIVAIVNDMVVGFASAVHYIHPDKPSELWINEVGVGPSHQKQGIAKAILKELLQRGRELGCKTAWVLTERDNGPANRLYRSAGGQVGPGETVMYEFDISES